jgi:hypothetical protein
VTPRVLETIRTPRRKVRRGEAPFYSLVHWPEIGTISVVWHLEPKLTQHDLEVHRKRVLSTCLAASQCEGRA